MSTYGALLRIRKWILRTPQILLWRMDFKMRWAPSVGHGLSWDVYLREVKNTLKRNWRMESLRKEAERWKEPGVVHQPIYSWLPCHFEGGTPYVCPTCKKVNNGGSPLIVFQTFGVWRSDGSRSPWVYTALSCHGCGMRKPDDRPYIPRDYGLGGLREPLTSDLASKELSYYLTYEVSYGSQYVRYRRQIRHRVTHALLDTRAEAVKFDFDKPAPQPDLEAREVSEVKVSGVELGQEHQLFQTLLPLIHEYEEGRMRKSP